MNVSTTKFVILYAEDDPDDVQLVRDCFKSYSDVVEILHAENGQEALNSLSNLEANGIRPCLIILDINMPYMDGRDTLIRIKNNNAYKNIPVVLFTTSNSALDKAFAKKWGADFITKPLKYEEVENLAKEFIKRCSDELDRRA